MPHILIVDDEPTVSWALSEGLNDDGFTTDVFRSAEDAWEWLGDHHSDLVIADLRLPGMTGIELARKLQRTDHRQPVILLTADPAPGTPAELARVGIVECFSKPFRIEMLRQAVYRALGQSASRHGRAA
jgi:DNA-binding NtrC family response regulator